jgi:hypothetical protein
MGMMSELGPVDPQIFNMPALGLGTALDHIAGVCEKHPASADMLSSYLQHALSIRHLGLYERVSESATHYGKKLVYGYKDHSFAIDCDEINEILGHDIVKIDTAEYRLADKIHQYLEEANFAYRAFHTRYCSLVGRVADGLSLSRLEQND